MLRIIIIFLPILIAVYPRLHPKMRLNRRQIPKLNLLQYHSFRSPHVLLEHLFKIEDIPDLTGLCHPTPILEPLPRIVRQSILS